MHTIQLYITLSNLYKPAKICTDKSNKFIFFKSVLAGFLRAQYWARYCEMDVLILAYVL